MLVVAGVLFAVNALRDNPFSLDLLAAGAVLLTFGHAQIADRMMEKEKEKAQPDVECYQKLLYYYVGKEVLWFLYFLLNQSYSALVGVVVFLIYPIWRRFYRGRIYE